ncbi:MAG: hypothetical protein ACR2NU_08840 [Aeoliella sp.]
MFGKRMLLSFMAIGALSIVGCGKKEVPQPEPITTTNTQDANAPKTLAEAVTKLAKHRDQLAAGFKAGDAKAASDAWHDLVPIAKQVKALGVSAELDRYDQADVEKAADQLVEILNTIHPPHGADAKVDPADYDKESDSINDAITNLETITAKTADAAAAE